MGLNGTRGLGTVLMAVGILLILSVGGYFAWTEVQAAQVRSELDQGAAAAAARATRVAQELALATPTGAPKAGANVGTRPTSTATKAPTLARPATSATSPAPATATAAATATFAPTAAPTSTPAPILPVRLVIPDLKIDTPVVEMGWNVIQTKSGPMSEWAIPKNVAGHHLNSASIGQQDNLVVSGHNNIYGKVFMPISQAWTNDGKVKVDNFTDRSHVLDGREVYLYDSAGKQYKYVVTDFLRLKDTGVTQKQREVNGQYILPTGDERVTIITCWPPTNNTHRLVVIARPEK
jgi:sortase A